MRFFPVSGCKTPFPINSHHASVETSPICRENYFILGEPIPPTSMIVVGKAKKKWIYSPTQKTSHPHHPHGPRIPIVDSLTKKPFAKDGKSEAANLCLGGSGLLNCFTRQLHGANCIVGITRIRGSNQGTT